MANIILRTSVPIFKRNFLKSRRQIEFILPSERKCLSTVKSSLKYFTKKHEWLTVDGEVATVGISHHAQESLGDIVYVQLPNVSDAVDPSVECGALESVKAASELYSPVSGIVTEINTTLEDNPELVNSDCYGKGWLFKLKVKDAEEINNLMKEEEYQKFIETGAESH